MDVVIPQMFMPEFEISFGEDTVISNDWAGRKKVMYVDDDCQAIVPMNIKGMARRILNPINCQRNNFRIASHRGITHKSRRKK